MFPSQHGLGVLSKAQPLIILSSLGCPNSSWSSRSFIFLSESRKLKIFTHLESRAIATPFLKPLEFKSVKRLYIPALLFRSLKGKRVLKLFPSSVENKALHKALHSTRKFYKKNMTNILVSLTAKETFCKAAFPFLPILFKL